MSNFWIFIWGMFAFLLAVGPLVVAAYLDYRDKIKNRSQMISGKRHS
jgi:hypothetical protein